MQAHLASSCKMRGRSKEFSLTREWQLLTKFKQDPCSTNRKRGSQHFPSEKNPPKLFTVKKTNCERYKLLIHTAKVAGQMSKLRGQLINQLPRRLQISYPVLTSSASFSPNHQNLQKHNHKEPLLMSRFNLEIIRIKLLPLSTMQVSILSTILHSSLP